MKSHKDASSETFSTKTRLGGLMAVGTLVAVLAFAGCSANKSDSASKALLTSTEVIELIKTPLTEATGITLASNDTDNGGVASVTIKRDDSGDFEFKTTGDTALAASAKGLVLVSDKVYVQFQDEVGEAIAGLSPDEWVMFGSPADLKEDGISADLIDAAVTGSESISDDMHQLGDVLGSSYAGWDKYVVVSSKKQSLSSEALYDLAPSMSETGSLQVGVDNKGRLSFVGLDQRDGSWGTTLKVTYDKLDVTVPEKVSDIDGEVLSEAIINGAEEESVKTSAQSFDRQIRTMAAFGTESDMNDVDPRRIQLFIDVLRADQGIPQDVPDATTDSASLERSHLRVLVWQGAGAASVKWTRLFCEVAACQSIVNDSPMLLSSVGENGKLFNPEVRQDVCVQFHARGKDAWLRLSSRANEQSIVSNVLEEACPGSIFPGIVPATGTTYANLAVGQTAAVTDPTW
jgi:hypothetical protein